MSLQYPNAYDTTDSLASMRQTLDIIEPSDHNDLANLLILLEKRIGLGTSGPTDANQTLQSTGPGVTGWVSTVVNPNTVKAGAVVRNIVQNGHGFSVGNLIYFSGAAFQLSKADNATDAEVVGMVTTVTNSNNFTLTTEGYVSGLSGLTPGNVYFLSASTFGALQATEPTTAGQISKPLFIADTSTSGYFHNYRGVVVGSATGGTTSTSSGNGSTLSIRPLAQSDTQKNSDDVLIATTGGIYIQLQDASTAPNKKFNICNASLSPIFITAQNKQLIGGVNSFTLPVDLGVEFIPYQSNWIVT